MLWWQPTSFDIHCNVRHTNISVATPVDQLGPPHGRIGRRACVVVAVFVLAARLVTLDYMPSSPSAATHGVTDGHVHVRGADLHGLSPAANPPTFADDSVLHGVLLSPSRATTLHQ